MQPYRQRRRQNLERREPPPHLRPCLDSGGEPRRPPPPPLAVADVPGQTLFATVVFIDIESFSALSRALGPQATAEMLNQYFTLLVECIERHGGIVDKLIGDGAMAVFGVPMPAGDEEDRAICAALALLEALDGWNRARRLQRLQPVRIRIGINSDQVYWGAIGAPGCRDVTVIGNGVNLAARLEKACKDYHARILISGTTRRRLKRRYWLRLADRVRLPGGDQAGAIYEVLDHHSERSFPQMARVLRHYHRGLACLRRQRFADALRAFDHALAIHPQDRLTRLHRSRCLAGIDLPPAAR